MTPATRMKCPVCQARQEVQLKCRRCGADLALYVKALRSLEAASRQYHQARQDGSPQRTAEAISYLMWLKPDATRPASDQSSLE